MQDENAHEFVILRQILIQETEATRRVQDELDDLDPFTPSLRHRQDE